MTYDDSVVLTKQKAKQKAKKGKAKQDKTKQNKTKPNKKANKQTYK